MPTRLKEKDRDALFPTLSVVGSRWYDGNASTRHITVDHFHAEQRTFGFGEAMGNLLRQFMSRRLTIIIAVLIVGGIGTLVGVVLAQQAEWIRSLAEEYSLVYKTAYDEAEEQGLVSAGREAVAEQVLLRLHRHSLAFSRQRRIPAIGGQSRWATDARGHAHAGSTTHAGGHARAGSTTHAGGHAHTHAHTHAHAGTAFNDNGLRRGRVSFTVPD